MVSVRMVEAARGARGRSALIWGGVRTRDSKLPLALVAKYRASASAWVRKPAPAMALGPRAGPVLGERSRELGVQFGPRAIRQQLVGHVALSFGLGVVIRQIHRARRGVGDGLVHFGPRVEIQQSRDDLGIDLAVLS